MTPLFLSSQGLPTLVLPTRPMRRPLLRRAGPNLAFGVSYHFHGYIYLGCHKNLGLLASKPSSVTRPECTQWAASYTGESCTYSPPLSHHGQEGALSLKAHGIFQESCISIHYPSQQNFLSHRDTRSLAQDHTARALEPTLAP